MYQLFTLFVLALGFSGFVLAFSFFDDKLRCGEMIREEAVRSPRFLMVLAVLLGLLTVLKLVFVHSGDIPVIGDILPVLAGGLTTFMLLADYFSAKADESGEEATGLFASVDAIFGPRRVLIGILVVIIAVVHFVIPGIVVL
jgi:hypothetical protein